MKFTYKLEGLHCGNCGGKIEREISKIKEVEAVSVIFMSQRLIIHADEAHIDKIEDEARKIVRKIASDAVMSGR
jgi:copper chaperone CopZ